LNHILPNRSILNLFFNTLLFYAGVEFRVYLCNLIVPEKEDHTENNEMSD